MVFGIDVGDCASIVSVPKAGGITVLNNEVSKRETASMISFGEKQRFLGEAAVDFGIRNWRNSVSHLKRLIGVDFDSEAAQYERKFVKNEMRADAAGRIEIKVHYKYDERWFKPEQLLAALLTQMRVYPELEAGDGKHRIPDPDCVASVPVYFTAIQRQLMIQALQISGLNPLSIMNENTAIALDYGIYKTANLPEKEEEAIHVAFVDIGNSASTISVVQFIKGQLKVLGHVWDKYLGCRDFDAALFDEFAKLTEAKYKFDINSEKKAALKLLSSCDKLKKVLSANPLGVLSCELPECDISFPFQREQAEALWGPLLDRVGALINKAKAVAGFEKVTTVELVGGGSRIPILKQMISDAFNGIPLSTTLHATESASKGCAIMAAMLSPKFKVREFTVLDSSPLSVSVGYYSDKCSNPISDSRYPQINKKISLLKVGNETPKTLNLTFDRSNDFELFVFYDEQPDVLCSTNNTLLGKWRISRIPSVQDPQVKVKVRLAPTMLVTVEGASVAEEKEVEEEVEVEVEVEVPHEGEGDKPAEAKKEKKKVKQLERRKRSIKHDCDVHQLVGLGNTSEVLKDLKDQEIQMVQSDDSVRATQEAKNSLESYIYDMRGRLSDGGLLLSYSTQQEREYFFHVATKVEEWLYGEGEDTSKEDYEQKLGELKSAARPITSKKEEEERKKKEEEERKRKEEEDRKKKEAEDKKKREEEEKERKKKEEEEKAAAAKKEEKPTEQIEDVVDKKMDLD